MWDHCIFPAKMGGVGSEEGSMKRAFSQHLVAEVVWEVFLF